MTEFDWRGYVGRQMGERFRQSDRCEELIEELAGYLEDTYQAGLRSGLSHEEAVTFTQQQVSDWHRLARKIRRADCGEDPMSQTAKTLWIPGTAVLMFSAVMLLVMARLVPPTIWLDRPALMIAPWLCSYFLFGAVGAWWSRRAGGSVTLRFLSGTFPIALHLAVFILPIVVAVTSDAPNFPEHRHLGWLLRTSLIWLLIPGVALAIGTLPFLKDSSPKSLPADS